MQIWVPLFLILQNFIHLKKIYLDSIFFLANGQIIDESEIIDQIMNENQKENKQLKILVNSIKTVNNDNKPKIISSEQIICPKCFEPCFFKIDDYFIDLHGCKYGHKSLHINLKDFAKTQKLNLSKIICDQCKNENIGITNLNNFYKCLSYDIKLCSLCQSQHDKSHNIINYEFKDFICNEHMKDFINYDTKCKKDICLYCETEHEAHNKEYYGNYLPNINKLKTNNSSFLNLINQFRINHIFKEIIENL